MSSTTPTTQIDTAICNALKNTADFTLPQDRDALTRYLKRIKDTFVNVADAHKETYHDDMKHEFHNIANIQNKLGPKAAADLIGYCAIFREKLYEIIKAHQRTLDSVNRIVKELVSERNGNLVPLKFLNNPKNLQKIIQALEDADSNFGSDDTNPDHVAQTDGQNSDTSVTEPTGTNTEPVPQGHNSDATTNSNSDSNSDAETDSNSDSNSDPETESDSDDDMYDYNENNGIVIHHLPTSTTTDATNMQCDVTDNVTAERETLPADLAHVNPTVVVDEVEQRINELAFSTSTSTSLASPMKSCSRERSRLSRLSPAMIKKVKKEIIDNMDETPTSSATYQTRAQRASTSNQAPCGNDNLIRQQIFDLKLAEARPTTVITEGIHF